MTSPIHPSMRLLAAVAGTAALTLASYHAWSTNSTVSGFTYSGTLRNHGVADSGTHSFEFTLVDGSGNALGCSDTRGSLAVSNGRFDVANLFGGCAALPGLLAATDAMSVRITVDGQQLSPDQPLGAVPFALHAAKADSAANAAPTPPVCTGSGKALQWTGTEWSCVTNGASKIVNVTTFVSSTRRGLSAVNATTMETITVDKKSPTSNLLIQATLSGHGDASGHTQQQWIYGSDAPVNAQSIMYSAHPTSGRIYPSTAVITGHATTGPQTLTLRYYAYGSVGYPFQVYNPSSAEDARIGQTSSVFSIIEFEP